MKFKKFSFKKVKNTNDTALKIIKKTSLNHGMIISENQKKGKGQYGRIWKSYKGNLFVSFFCNIERVDISMKDFTKINCRIAKKTISNFCKKKITFKLPNDLLVNGKKICGILQERINRDNQKFLVVGIGINIDKSPVILNYPTTNLNEVTGKKVSYKSLVKLLKLNFEKRYFKFLKR
tara:strand:- start:110 stop:643 length:534 start_codon:yes stop_codon:yes gene_type:complete